VALLRTRKAFWISFLTVAAASLFPLLAWPSPGSPLPYKASIEAFRNYAGAVTAALFLFVPAVTAGAISGERERDTYELLYSTLIRPSGIVIGKLVPAAGFFFLLLVLTSPMVCVLYLLGGLEFSHFLSSFTGTAVIIIFTALVGLWSSMKSRRTYRALIAAFAMLVILTFLFSIVGAYSFLLPTGSGLAISPFRFWATSVLTLVVSLVMFASLLDRARFPHFPASRREELRDAFTARLRGPAKLAARTLLARLVLHRVSGGIPDGWNPILVNGIRGEVFGSTRFRRRLFWAFATAAGLVTGFYLLSTLDRPFTQFSLLDPLAATTLVLLCSIALLLPGCCAASLTSEREPGKLDFLRSTLLTPGQILRGKLWASLFGVSGLLILGAIYSVAVFVVSLPFGDGLGRKAAVGLAFLVTGATVMLACATSGLLAAALSRTTVAAAVLAYVVSGILVVIPLLLAWPFFIDIWRFDEENSWAYLNPLVGFVRLVDGLVNERPSIDGARILAFAVSHFVSLCVSSFTFAWAVVIFDRRWMRDP